MKGYNHVTLVGNLVKETISTETNETNESRTATVIVAVKRSFKKGQENEIDFIPIKATGGLEKVFSDHLEPGTRVLIDGFLCVNNYEKPASEWKMIVEATEITLLSTNK